MTGIPVKRSATGAGGEERELKRGGGIRHTEPLAGEVNWTHPLSLIPSYQMGSKAGVLQARCHGIWAEEERRKHAGVAGSWRPRPSG